MSLFKKKTRMMQQHELKQIGNGDAESRLIKKENKRIWITIGIASFTILVIIVTSCIIDIYEKAYNINEYFGYGVLAVLLLLILFFIIIPLIKVLCAPTFTLDASKNDEHLSRKRFRTLKSVAKNIVKGKNSVPDNVKQCLMDSLNDRYQLRDELNLVYDKYIKKDINKIIWATSAKVACSTGVSKNNTFDAATTIISNVRMIMQIVIKCGYRPTYTKLGKLMFKVFRNALIAYSIESSNVAEWLVNACSKFFKDLPAIGKPIAAIMEGAANGFLTARIGVITRKYLYSEFKINNSGKNIEEIETEIYQESIKEAKLIIDESGA
ncbi:MAG: DUF697 domain-containing protein [Bacilli bacterium]|nr:DUF697 domain-containing protein [Bacilli bacterium]